MFKKNKSETRKKQLEDIYGINKEFTKLPTGCISTVCQSKGQLPHRFLWHLIFDNISLFKENENKTKIYGNYHRTLLSFLLLLML